MKSPMILLAPLLIVLLASCGIQRKDNAIGESDIITIICDSMDYALLEDVIENAFAQPFFTPQPETWFRLLRYDLADLLERKRDRNILILAALDADHALGEYMRGALDADVRKLVDDGKEHVFVQKDLWYRGQVVSHLTARSIAELGDYLLTNGPKLEYYFRQAWDERERARMLNLPREEEVEAHLRSEYAFSLAVIRNWFIAKDSSEINTVLLRRQHPAHTERWLMVHWMDTTNTALLTSSFALELRDRLTEILYRTYDDSTWAVVDTVNHLQFDEVNFQDRFAIRMKGLWRMQDFSMGGPFVSYLFYDETQQRIYFLDGSVFAPRYEKKKLIQDVDVMMKTFVTASDDLGETG